MQRVVLLGASGSIGTSVLNLLRKTHNSFSLLGISVHRNVEAAKKIIAEFAPKYLSVSGLGENDLPQHLPVKLLPMCEMAAIDEADCVVVALPGLAALRPVLAAIEAGKRIVMANKEAIVCAGALIGSALLRSHALLLPADSEHCGIFQCLSGEKNFRGVFRRSESLDHVWLTASGGPFFDLPDSEFDSITVESALRHPTWSMGAKISIDSATMANKGLEIIEAGWLYGLRPGEISVAVHRSSIVHALVRFCDGTILAQMSPPSMEIPLGRCLVHPEKIHFAGKMLNPLEPGIFEFHEADRKRFPCLALGERAFSVGLSAPCAFDAANSAAVEAFMRREIPFRAIPLAIEHTLSTINFAELSDADSVEEHHSEAHGIAMNFLKKRF